MRWINSIEIRNWEIVSSDRVEKKRVLSKIAVEAAARIKASSDGDILYQIMHTVRLAVERRSDGVP